MNKIKEYIAKIVINGKNEDMDRLSEMFEDLLSKIKNDDPKCYEKYKNELYEMAYGKKITEEIAKDWVSNMEPVGEYWTMEEVANAMRQLNYNFDLIDFYTTANMIMNDYNDIVKDDETLALRMAKDWLNDKDAKENKLFEYWKHIVK